jgi:hypothetical protein
LNEVQGRPANQSLEPTERGVLPCVWPIPKSRFCVNFAPERRLTLNHAVSYTGNNEVGAKGGFAVALAAPEFER